MTDLLEQATDWLQRMQQQHVSKPVTYHREQQSIELTATIGKTVFRTEDEFGRVQHFESRDFLIPSEQLTDAPPQRGDRIRETQADKTFVYEVMAPGKEPHFRLADTYRRTLRVHTKLVDIEDV